MTHDKVDSVQSDIAYLKQLAIEGRDAPVLVGPVLVAAAVIFGLPSVVQWAIVAGMVNVPPMGMIAMWLGAGLVFAVAVFMITRKADGRSAATTIRNRTMSAAWSACGYSIFAAWLSLLAYGFSTGQWAPMALMPTLVMIAYGSAWLIGGMIVERGWMVGVGLVSYLGAIALGWFANTHMVFGVYLVMLVCVALLPGLYLMRQSKGQS